MSMPSQTGPLWSVMIPTYNPDEWLRLTLAAILSQDPGPDLMQIEVVDDASTRVDVRRVVHDIAGDRVSFFRQDRNVGICENWNTCIRRARGDLVHLLHQDDLVDPGFYAALGRGLAARPDAGAAFTRWAMIDSNGDTLQVSELEQPDPGILENWIDKIAVTQRIVCASVVVRREVYQFLGLYRADLAYALDWEMWRRIACHYPVWYEPAVLASWRIHNQSESRRLLLTCCDLADIRRSIDIVDALLPRDKAAQLTSAALRHYAMHGGRLAGQSFAECRFRLAMDQLRQSLAFEPSPLVLLNAVYAMIREWRAWGMKLTRLRSLFSAKKPNRPEMYQAKGTRT